MASLPYRPEIDGLRAIAVLAVIAFHLNGNLLPGGYLGVDVFFVISGYLITSIIRSELENGSFSFRRFWARRIRRILPAMLLVTLVTATLSQRFSFPPDRPHLGLQATSAMMSLANVCFWRTSGNYWGSDAETSPFLHLWSLSVEEQFYLLHPLLLFVVARLSRNNRRWILLVLLTVFVFSFALFLAGTQWAPTATFYLLPTRAWELTAGCALAYTGTSDRLCRGLAGRLLHWCGLVLIAVSFLFSVGIACGAPIATTGTLLLIAASHWQNRGIAASLLASRPAVSLGRLSYSLYLWHWPFIVFAFNADPTPKARTILLVFAFTVICAVLSWKLVECPARKPGTPFRTIFVGYSVVLAASVVMMLLPAPQLDVSGWNKTSWLGRFYDLSPTGGMDPAFQRLSRDMDVPERTATGDAYRNGGIIAGDQKGDPEIVLLGDSHGVMWSEVVKEVAARLDTKVALISMNGVLPFFYTMDGAHSGTTGLTVEQQREYDHSRMNLIRKWKPEVVIVACRWSTVSFAECLSTLRFLNEHAKQTLLLEQPPELQRVGNRNALEYAAWNGAMPQPWKSSYLTSETSYRVAATRQMLERLMQEYSHCSIIRVRETFINNSDEHSRSQRLALVTLGLNAVYVDDDHLSTFGSRLAMSEIYRAISTSLTRARMEE